MGELITGYLWEGIKTKEDVQYALDKYPVDRPAVKEVRAAIGLKEPLADLEGIKVFFERNVPAESIFLVIGEV